ncbi:MAG: hypothetical protein ACI87E_001233 [Mariniblastus sp.]|jgi:uncharacterized protein YqjF (DUF2071 family)
MATTSQPASPPKSTQQKLLAKTAYTELVAVNFQVPPKLLADMIPKGLELDYYEKETFVSLVCMTMRKVGVLGIPLTRGFVELSLRFYVRHPADPVNRKGTCFIKNYVSSPTAAWILGSRYDCEYHKMKMKSNNSGFKVGGVPEVEYQWKVDDHWNKLRVKARSEIRNTGPDTKVGFILDHPTHFQSKINKTLEYQVERPKWTVWDAAQANFTCDVNRLFGKAFVQPLGKRPASVFVTQGSDVTIYRPTEL